MATLATKNVLGICRQQAVSLVGASAICRRDSSSLAEYKRGRGGRSSFNGDVVTVLGASGMLGKVVVNRLGKVGAQLICPYRCDPYFMRPLKLAGDLGQVLFFPFDLKDEESMRQVMRHSNVVVNLIGKDRETANWSFQDVHVDGAARIARIAAECGVKRLIHMSANGATLDPAPVFLKNGSGFLRSKYEGEVAVRREFPDATIMRLPDVFGFDDRFLYYYAHHRRRWLNMVPLYARGEKTFKSPVFASDVARGILNAIHDRTSEGQLYECVGPRTYTNAEIVDYVYRCLRWPGVTRTWINPVWRAKVKLYSKVSPMFIHDERIERESVSNYTKAGSLTLEDLGVQLTLLEHQADYQLKNFRRVGYIRETGLFHPAEPKFVAEIN